MQHMIFATKQGVPFVMSLLSHYKRVHQKALKIVGLKKSVKVLQQGVVSVVSRNKSMC